ncbi:MAG: hypothetical protein GYA51_14395 [Candidatus Methanofastidiosa archaeon]|jgi:multisubunit Na+/H+ antiporter MnhF subunit|nr:hypothetical protein [Candidatus Methanofastidiosa archaeon]
MNKNNILLYLSIILVFFVGYVLHLEKYYVYVLLIGLAVAIMSGLRVTTFRGVCNSLTGAGAAEIGVATGFMVVGKLYGIPYFSDIAIYLLLLGPIGTLIMARFFRGGIAE